MVAVDISYAQGYPNYDKLATNISLVIARAGTLEGGGKLQDSKLEYNRANARRLGKQFGTYLFNGPVNPTEAARWYVSIIDYKPGDLTAIDVENPNAWNPSQVLEFLREVKRLLGVVPATYGSTSLLFQPGWKAVSDFGSPLWAANYGANTGSPGRDPGNGPWATRILWQYTSTAQHSGFPGSVDTNQINDAALNTYLGQAAPEPEKEDDMALSDQIKSADGTEQRFDAITAEMQKNLRDLKQASLVPRADGVQTSAAVLSAVLDGVQTLAKGMQLMQAQLDKLDKAAEK